MAKHKQSAPPDLKSALGVPQFAKVPQHVWIKPWADCLLIAVFGMILALPPIAWLFRGEPAQSLGENRRLATMPSLSGRPYEKWPGVIDTYFRDNFGFRNTLIHANNVILRLWLGISAENLVIGKERWVFYRDPSEKIFENHMGLDPLTDQQLEIWKGYLEGQQKLRAARNSKYLFVIAPDKESIYPEMLPVYLSHIGRSRVDQLMKYLRDTNSAVNVLDLRSVLLAAKGDGLVFLPHDTHWNGRGYFAAYREISRRLKEWFPDLPRQELGTNFAIKRIASMDALWAMVGLPEENLNYPYDVLVPFDKLRAKREPPDLPIGVPDPAAPWLAAIRTASPSGKHRLLLLHDSFMSYGVENRADGPLTRDFEATLSIGRYLTEPAVSMLEDSFHPDVVIEEWVERQIRSTQ